MSRRKTWRNQILEDIELIIREYHTINRQGHITGWNPKDAAIEIVKLIEANPEGCEIVPAQPQDKEES
jgi:hypothetical protein